MYTREQLSELIESYISNQEFPATPESLYAPVKYSLDEGGKRIRPILLLMAYDIFGEDIRQVLPLAAAVEYFHTFTLIHDDMMDNDMVRRGKSCVYLKWSPNTAILSGDAMLILAYKLLQQAPPDKLPQILYEFNKMAVEVCKGQQFDLDFESRDNVGIEEYTDMIRLKTASLLAGSLKIGAILAGADSASCESLYNFGIELGIAYQLQDDYLDTYGTAEVLGKNIGNDISENKKTFLTIQACNNAGDATRRALVQTLKDKSIPLNHKINRVKTIYNSLDIPSMTKKVISDHLAAATLQLEQLKVKDENKQHLKDFIDILSNRNN